MLRIKLLYTIMLVFASTSLIVGCGESEADLKDQGKNKKHYDIEIDTANPPVIEFEEMHHDFGTLDKGDVVKHIFNFENTGGSPLLLNDVYSSCGCTVPSYPDYPINPGESGEIRVVFNSKNKNGKVHKKIKIKANTYPEKMTVISISAKVE